MLHPDRNCAIPAGATNEEAALTADLWFPTEMKEANYARRLCMGCPVREKCLDYAMERPELEGIWGQTTAAQRGTMRRKARGVGNAA
jgi:hypothetical protein